MPPVKYRITDTSGALIRLEIALPAPADGGEADTIEHTIPAENLAGLSDAEATEMIEATVTRVARSHLVPADMPAMASEGEVDLGRGNGNNGGGDGDSGAAGNGEAPDAGP
jgi:hypothetical protein